MLVCDKCDRAITYVFCRDLHLTLMFSVFFAKKICFKKVKFGKKLFRTKLLYRLSHKVCRLLPSPVLLRKFTNIHSLRSSDQREKFALKCEIGTCSFIRLRRQNE